MRQNLDEAFGALGQACFLQNDQILIDPEGCHFLGQAALPRRNDSARDEAAADYLAYLSFAQSCTDNAETVCEEARDLYQREARKGAGWIGRCDQQAGRYGDVTSCANFAKPADDYDAAQVARRQLVSCSGWSRRRWTEVVRGPASAFLARAKDRWRPVPDDCPEPSADAFAKKIRG